MGTGNSFETFALEIKLTLAHISYILVGIKYSTEYRVNMYKETNKSNDSWD